jgi:hypothetical protein
MSRSTRFAAFIVALAVCGLAAFTTLRLLSAAPLAGGSTGNEIHLSPLTLSLDLYNQQPVEGDCIARGQPFWVRSDDIYDPDPPGDPPPEYDEIVSAVWQRRDRPTGGEWSDWHTEQQGAPEYKGNGHYRSVLAQCLDADGDYEYKLTVDDEGHPEPDAPAWDTRQVKVRGVDYVIVVPNPASVSVGGSVGLTGKAYNMGGDGERHFDDSGNPIEATADNDVQLGATFHWSFDGLNLGELSPTTGPSTTFTAYTTAGQCHVTATYDPGGANITGAALVIVTSPEGYWIDLTGINYDDVQNVPINGWGPAGVDGTGNVGQMKAKVVITGQPDTEYDVCVTSQNFNKISIGGDVHYLFSLTTNSEGTAEQEFELHAESTTPSAWLEDITLEGEMCEDGASEPCAATQEKITLYQFYFDGSEGDTTDDYESDEHMWSGGDADTVTSWHEQSGLGDDSSCGRLRHYRVAVWTEPIGAWYGTVKGKLHTRLEGADLEVCMSVANWSYDETSVTIGVSFKVENVTVSVSRTFTTHSEQACGLAAGDVGIIVGGVTTEAGDKCVKSSEVPAPDMGDYTEQFLLHFPAKGIIDQEREYDVGMVYDDLAKVEGSVSCRVDGAHFPESPMFHTGVDVQYCVVGWALDENLSQGVVTLSEDDGVFEMVAH